MHRSDARKIKCSILNVRNFMALWTLVRNGSRERLVSLNEKWKQKFGLEHKLESEYVCVCERGGKDAAVTQ